MSQGHSFARQFKKYRLRSEFETLSDFADALANEKYTYEESLYSHWQKGTRVPKSRALLLTILKIFIKKDGITNLRDANTFLAAADQGYLTEAEIDTLPTMAAPQGPFTAPKEILYFTGRESIISTLKNQLAQAGQTVVIHGAPGTGKTALSIKLANMLREDFPDGVLWFRLDTTSPLTILGIIANLFDQDVSRMKNIEARATFIRSLLATKKILYVFDNVLPGSELIHLLPNSKESSVMVTSLSKDIDIQANNIITIQPFSEDEGLRLFYAILGYEYTQQNNLHLKELISKMNGSPLGLHIAARQIHYELTTIDTLLNQIALSEIDLKAFKYENKNILTVLELSFTNLTQKAQGLFLSLRAFYGHDFTLSAVAYINNLSIKEAQALLNEITNYALIEISKKGRYRLHPFILTFIKSREPDLAVYVRANKYYIQFLKKSRGDFDNLKKQVDLEMDTMYELIQKFHKYKVWKEVILLAECFIPILWARGNWKAIEKLCRQANFAADKLNDSNAKIKFWVMETILPKPL